MGRRVQSGSVSREMTALNDGFYNKTPLASSRTGVLERPDERFITYACI